MKTRLSSLIEIKLIGIEIRTSNQKESDPSQAKIPGLWKHFMEQRIATKIPNIMRPGTIFAVYRDYESDFRGDYTLTLACQVSSLESIPKGMTGFTIPTAKYMVFTAEGKIPESIIQTWGSIWKYFSDSPPYQRAYTADFEIHDKRSQSENPEVEIHIAVR
jgi:predicted transcriptional regulator YdeE